MSPEEELLEAIFAHAAAQPIGALVDTEALLRHVERSFDTDASTVEKLWRRFVAPARERLLAAHEQSPRHLGAWLPVRVREALADLLGAPATIPKSWVRRVVSSPEFHAEVRHQIEETLREATAELFGKRGAGGLAAFARAGAAMGKGLFGGLGDKLEERLADAASAALARLEKRIVHLAASPKSARRAGELRRKVFLGLLASPESELVALIRRAPHAALDALVAPLVVHNLARPELRAVILEETRALLSGIATQPLGELLDELGIRARVHDAWLKLASFRGSR